MNRLGTIGGIAVCCLIGFTSAATAHELKPLKYNNPGLVVDLGVGLWAFPMPIDYDDDGDMDLMVGSMDKPSRGTYLFENPTQDPSITMPVFKPGVRIGTAHQYMTINTVDGQPVVLRPDNAYRRDPATGQFDFKKAQPLGLPPNPAVEGHRPRGRFMRYVDYDGDGDQDIALGAGLWDDLGWDHAYDNMGRWQNGPLHGHVDIYDNAGTDQSPDYQPPVRLSAAGGPIDVYGWPCPNFADFDGDGDLDLLCGEFMDGFTYFQNMGTRTEPTYAAGVRIADAAGSPISMHVQMITPTAVDWDRDGDVDLIVGDEDGRVALVEHTGKWFAGTPIFAAPKYFQQIADELKFGALATPHVIDWDDDGDLDLLCGNTAGNIGWFENLGVPDPVTTDGLPRWAAPELLQIQNGDGETEDFRVMAGPSGSIQGPCEAKWGYTTLTTGDIDSDGDDDIIYNSILAKLGWLQRDGDRLTNRIFDSGQLEMPPRWLWWRSLRSDALTQWRTTPVLVDFDEDDHLDLVMLDQEGYLTLRRSMGPAERIFVDPTGQPLQLNPASCGRSGRVKMAVVDWDGDGRRDLLVNSENATWYRNLGRNGEKVTLAKIGNLADRNVAGHTSSPTTGDFSGDGKPDLLVGSENGRIYYIEHDQCLTYPERELAGDTTKPPPPRIGGMIEEATLDPKKFQHAHTSTLCENSRGVVIAWVGKVKGQTHTSIWCGYDDGLQWSGSAEVATGRQRGDLVYPCWNPVLVQTPGDGPTILFYKVGESPQSWWGEYLVSQDRGRTWSQSYRLPEGIVGPIRSAPVWTGDDRLLSGASTESDGWKVHFESVRFADGRPQGVWTRTDDLEASAYQSIQPAMLRHDDGRIQAICRTNQGVLTTTWSEDDGKTWSPLQNLGVPHPNSAIDAITLSFLAERRKPPGAAPILAERRKPPGAASLAERRKPPGAAPILAERRKPPGDSPEGLRPTATIDGASPEGLRPTARLDKTETIIPTGHQRHWMVGNFQMPGSNLGGREILSLLASDDGLQWRPIATLDTRPGGEICYPSMIQSADGLVHITYTDGKTSIRHMVLDPMEMTDAAGDER